MTNITKTKGHTTMPTPTTLVTPAALTAEEAAIYLGLAH